MDDFGTGYSSLSYIRRFPFDKIKIDKAFIAELGVREESTAIVRAAIGLAQALGMRTVAEGIETEDQLRLARVEGLHGGPRLSDRASDAGPTSLGAARRRRRRGSRPNGRNRRAGGGL